MTIIVDDAGSGDILFGVIIGAYRTETNEFKYGLVDVKFFQPDVYCKKKYLAEATKVVSDLLAALKVQPEEQMHLCQGYIFDDSAAELKKSYGEERIQRIRVTGEAQRLTEIAYLDEIRNLGYEPLTEREEKRAKSFFHMMRWLKANPDMLKYAKTGWPRLKRYRLFKSLDMNDEPEHTATCSECGTECEVPFKPDPHRPVYCRACWAERRPKTKSRKA
ncbi:MAG TPA: CxxC-x17-CxxC domain-containing protein [Candidatus Bathyarchaeia archaeon]